MSARIFIDHDRLADGLETGIGETRTMFASVTNTERLRIAPCGLVNTAIHQYARSIGLDSRLLLSRPFDFGSDGRHVLAVVDDTVIDGAYSFVFEYVGMSWQYMYAQKCADIFPPEKVISFSFSETEIVARGLARTAYAFRERNMHPVGIYGEDVGSGLLSGKTEHEITAAYSQIYDMDRYADWDPPSRVYNDAAVVAAAIMPGTITKAVKV